MAGLSMMGLGGWAFEAYGFSFTDRGHEVSTDWAEIEVAGSMNPLQWTGGQSETLTIRGVLFPQSLGGLGTLSGLKLASTAGRVLPLVMLEPAGGNILGMWVITKVGDDATLFLGGGPLRDAYRLTLRKSVSGFGGHSIPSVLSLF